MGRHEILMNYEQVLRQAERLETAAKNLDKMAKIEFREARADLASGWSGDVSASFLRKSIELERRLSTTSLDLMTIADGVRKKAVRIRNAELAALDIAQSRTYNGSGGGFSRGGGEGFGGGSGGGR